MEFHKIIVKNIDGYIYIYSEKKIFTLYKRVMITDLEQPKPITTIVGIFLFSIAVISYYVRLENLGGRIGFLIGGILLGVIGLLLAFISLWWPWFLNNLQGLKNRFNSNDKKGRS